MLSRASHERNDPAKLQTHLLAVDLYLDNVQVGTRSSDGSCRHIRPSDRVYLANFQSQAEHLRQLDPKELLVPVDLYHAPRNSNEAPARKVILDSLPGRRLSEEERKGNVSDALAGRMFQGPEPSWIRKRKINPSQH